jgi:hypothetical protein
MALIGQAPVSSLVDGGPVAAEAGRLLPVIRDQVLAGHPWNCVKRRAVLAPSATAPAFGWAAAYPLPAEVLRVIECQSAGARFDDWEREGDQILCDQTGGIQITFVRRPVSWGELSPWVGRVIAAELAQRLAYRATQGAGHRENLGEYARRVLADAKMTDGQEGGSRTFPISTLERARG